jgi:hypothetical protein
VERSSGRTPSKSSSSAMLLLTVETGIFSRPAASEKLFASTTLANTINALRSAIKLPRSEKVIPASAV